MRATTILSVIAALAVAGACSKDDDGDEKAEDTAAVEKTPAGGDEAKVDRGGSGGDPGAEATAHGGGDPSLTEAGQATALGDGKVAFGSFVVTAPETWTAHSTGDSKMRAAQWTIAGAGGAKDAELVVYYFGPGGAGTVDANLERWYGQFEQPDGSESKEAASVEEVEIAGRSVTTIDLAGHYVARVTPRSKERHDEPGWRMLAAIVPADEGPYFFKMVGPAKTVAAAKPGFDAMLESIATRE